MIITVISESRPLPDRVTIVATRMTIVATGGFGSATYFPKSRVVRILTSTSGLRSPSYSEDAQGLSAWQVMGGDFRSSPRHNGDAV